MLPATNGNELFKYTKYPRTCSIIGYVLHSSFLGVIRDDARAQKCSSFTNDHLTFLFFFRHFFFDFWLLTNAL
jgi:hypothetical protein